MSKKISLIGLALAIILGVVPRFYKLGEAPAGLYLDEAAQGYNAYSILKTGKDEFGKSLPIVFRSFTDFKTPIYIYLIVPLIPIFGLTKFTVRFPSFLFSIFTLPIVYLLLKEISPRKYVLTLSLLTTLLLAISPWHILFGRTNFECNVALFFFLTGVLLFYKGLKRPNLLLASSVFFALAIPAYHAQRVVTPLMIFILFLRHRKTLLAKTHKRFLFLGVIIGIIISIPTLSVATTPGFLARASGLNIFAHQRQLPAGFLDYYQDPLSFLINGSWFLTTREFLALYLSYFSPRNMFILGDSGPRSSFPELATFFLWQFPFYIYGLYLFVKNKNLGELRFFTFALLLISPIPAAITRDPYSTIRSLQMAIPLLTIISFGIIKFYENLQELSTSGVAGWTPPRWLRWNYLKITLTVLVPTLTISYSLLRLHSSVIVLNEFYRAKEWNYGFEKVAQTLKNLNPNLPVVVDNVRTEPYSQLLFFLKFDPVTYQKENFEVPLSEYYTNMGRNKTKKIGNIITRPIEWEKDLLLEQYLVGDSLAISYEQIERHSLTLMEEVKYPDVSVAFRIVKTTSNGVKTNP